MTSADPRHGRLMRRWGRLVARRARTVVVLWIVLITGGLTVVSGVLGNDGLFGRLHSGQISVGGPNQAGRDLLSQSGASGFSTYTLSVQGVDLDDPVVATAARSSAAAIARLPHVESVVNPYVVPGGPDGPLGRSLIGTKPGQFATTVTYAQGLDPSQIRATQRTIDTVFDQLVTQTNPSSSTRGGLQELVDRIIEQVKIDGQRGEGIALPISFVVMVVVFGGFVAAGLPIFGAVASIAGALMSLLGFSYLLELDATVVNVVTVLGLGLCIDYGLLMVGRFREEAFALRSGRSTNSLPSAKIALAVERSMDRAGRTIIFSALTVAIALAGLLVFDIPFIRALAAAAVSVVLVSLAVALTLIPALCVLGARRLLGRGSTVAPDDGLFSRLAQWVQRRPWLVIVTVSASLLALAAPALGMRLVESGPALLPVGTAERTFFEDFTADYPALAAPELTLVSRAPVAEVNRYATTAAHTPGVQSVDPAKELPGGIVSLGLRTGDGGAGDASRTLVTTLRNQPPPFTAYPVGQASALADFGDAVIARAPWAITLVALVTLVLLFLMTGSVVIPFKALLMNIVSLGACVGTMVWIFQYGHLEGLLHFDSVGAIEHTVPLLVLAFGFGLSMDYEVFLLSRIIELHNEGHATGTAVRLGLQRSGRIITSAALLMVIVFAGFAAGDLLIMKQMGVALVLAIAIDATLVRMLLVPATMTVLGDRNWWAPGPLARVHARWGISE